MHFNLWNYLTNNHTFSHPVICTLLFRLYSLPHPFLSYFITQFLTLTHSHTHTLSSRQAFFTDLKHRVQRGRIPIPRDLRPSIGALTAQVEIGSYKETLPRSQALVYPPYFPEWGEGIAYQISREHKKLSGEWAYVVAVFVGKRICRCIMCIILCVLLHAF